MPATPAAGSRAAAHAPPRAARDARPIAFAALIAALAIAAWAALALWSAGPYARYVVHDGWTAPAQVGALCEAVPGGRFAVPALLHAGAWLLMIAAMMLPTTIPLLATFGRVVAGRRDAGALFVLAVAGYLVAWSGFGVAAHAADEALRFAAAGSPWLAGYAWAVGAAVLAGAGLFQFSALKYRCLDACRSTFGFVTSRWHGRSPRAEAFRIGVDHGLFCVGCCWALMLVMFAVGTASLGWMLGLGLAMAAEKNLPGGKRLSAPLGVALLAAAAALVAGNVP